MTAETFITVALEENPELEELMEYADALGITSEAFLTGDDYLAIEFSKNGYVTMVLEDMDGLGDNDYEWAFAPGDELFAGDSEAALTALRSHFA